MNHQEMLDQLTPEQREAHRSLSSMIDTAGWELFSKDADTQITQAQTKIENAHSWEQYHYAKGYKEALLLTVTLAERIERDFTLIAEQNSLSGEEAEDADIVEAVDFI